MEGQAGEVLLAEGGGDPLLKVKDWPQEEHFSVRMVRHNQVS
jgi:hypothetical protein